MWRFFLHSSNGISNSIRLWKQIQVVCVNCIREMKYLSCSLRVAVLDPSRFHIDPMQWGFCKPCAAYLLWLPIRQIRIFASRMPILFISFPSVLSRLWYPSSYAWEHTPSVSGFPSSFAWSQCSTNSCCNWLTASFRLSWFQRLLIDYWTISRRFLESPLAAIESSIKPFQSRIRFDIWTVPSVTSSTFLCFL